MDDIIKVYLGLKEVIEKHAASAPLALFVSMRPLSEKEPVPRKETLSLPKLQAEGTPSEMIVVLGWWLDTRRLLLRLPDDKFKNYSEEVQKILDQGRVNGKDLESIIGKFVHASYAVPLSCHYLDNFRLRLKSLKKANPYQAQRLSKQEELDFKLWLKILAEADQGVSLNGLVYRKPTRLGFSDSCPFGKGGFTHGGRGWRLKLSPQLAAYGKDVSNNLFEFLGMSITIWLSLIECHEQKLVNKMILILGDNTCAISWIFKSGLNTKSIYWEAVLFIARKLAELVINSKNFIDSQHLLGVLNLISDWLSFEGVERIEKGQPKVNPIAFDCPDNNVITHQILQSFPQLVPYGFKVCHLPVEILSFAQHAIQIFESSLMRQQKVDRRLTTEFGGDGEPTVRNIWETQIPALSEYQQRTPSFLAVPSLKCIEDQISQSQELLLDGVRFPWRVRLSEQPSAHWVQRCGTITEHASFTKATIPSANTPSTSENIWLP